MVSKMINDGGTAFPRPLSSNPNNGETYWEQDGMSLRDYFAGQAMSTLQFSFNEKFSGGDYTIAAEHFYKLADAMLAERAKERTTT
jgi:hypothetical protein